MNLLTLVLLALMALVTRLRKVGVFIGSGLLLVAANAHDGDEEHTGHHWSHNGSTAVVATVHRTDHCNTNALESDEDFIRCWYVGYGYGLSHVDPEGRTNLLRYRTDDLNGADGNMSEGSKFYVGYWFDEHLFAEFSYADLGEARITSDFIENPSMSPTVTASMRSNGFGKSGITYKIPSLQVGYSILDAGNNFQPFVKLGVSAIINEAADWFVDYEEQTNTQFTLALGTNYRLPFGLFARAEVDFYDIDAIHATLGVGKYFDGRTGEHAHIPLTGFPSHNRYDYLENADWHSH